MSLNHCERAQRPAQRGMHNSVHMVWPRAGLPPATEKAYSYAVNSQIRGRLSNLKGPVVRRHQPTPLAPRSTVTHCQCGAKCTTHECGANLGSRAPRPHLRLCSTRPESPTPTGPAQGQKEEFHSARPCMRLPPGARLVPAPLVPLPLLLCRWGSWG